MFGSHLVTLSVSAALFGPIGDDFLHPRGKDPRPPALYEVRKLQTSPSWKDRDNAAAALSRYDWVSEPFVAEALASALVLDEHKHVRLEAAESLGRLNPPPCLPGVHSALAHAAREDGDHFVRKAARRALERLDRSCGSGCDVCEEESHPVVVGAPVVKTSATVPSPAVGSKGKGLGLFKHGGSKPKVPLLAKLNPFHHLKQMHEAKHAKKGGSSSSSSSSSRSGVIVGEPIVVGDDPSELRFEYDPIPFEGGIAGSGAAVLETERRAGAPSLSPSPVPVPPSPSPGLGGAGSGSGVRPESLPPALDPGVSESEADLDLESTPRVLEPVSGSRAGVTGRLGLPRTGGAIPGSVPGSIPIPADPGAPVLSGPEH